jgi:hypothetical protein
VGKWVGRIDPRVAQLQILTEDHNRRIFESDTKTFFTRRKACWVCLCSVMSRATTEAPTTMPFLLFTGDIVTETLMGCPSLCTREFHTAQYAHAAAIAS